MMKRNKWIGLLLVLLVTFGANAQRTTSMRINEVLVINEDNFLDDYGQKGSWFELYNTSAGTVDVRGCYLTNDKNNPKMYMIPKGDVLTKVKPGQHILFWADSKAIRGTFHVNFSFDPNGSNYIALYDSDGKTLIDEVTVPAGQKADISYYRIVDGKDEWGQTNKVTPSTNNLTLDTNEKIENFKENDSMGVAMTITAMTVVFLALILLYLVFKQVGKTAVSISKRNARKAAGITDTKVETVEESGELFAAIATALYEVTEDVHDLENTVLTINKVARTYSPWSSKIYGLREIPKK